MTCPQSEHCCAGGRMPASSWPVPGDAPNHDAFADENLRGLISSAVSRFLAGESVSSDDESECESCVMSGESAQRVSCASSQAESEASVRREPSVPSYDAPTHQADSAACHPNEADSAAFGRSVVHSDYFNEKLGTARSRLAVVLKSLYRDRIYPSVKHVERRLLECDYGNNRTMVEDTLRNLWEICGRFPNDFVVVGDRKSELCAIMLSTAPVWFEGWIGLDGSLEYDAAIWKSLIASLRVGGAGLPCDTYLAAKELRARGVAGLEGLCLAELEQIVSIALSRKMLVRTTSIEGRSLKLSRDLLAIAKHPPKKTSDDRANKLRRKMLSAASCLESHFHHKIPLRLEFAC